jgi:hypothetical protein
MLLRILEELARRRRRPGSHPAWTAVTLAAFLLRRHQLNARRNEVSLRELLQPGDSVVITNTTQHKR